MSTELLNRMLLRCKDLLCNLTKTNREIFFKERSSSISLSELTIPVDLKDSEKEEYKSMFKPISIEDGSVEELIEKSKLSLTKYFKLNKFQNKNLERKIEKLKQNDDKYQREFGISGAWLLGPFLIWKLKSTSNDEFVTLSPLFKIPIDIEKNKSEYSLILEDYELEINASLALILKKEYGIELPPKFEGKKFKEAIDDIIEIFHKNEIKISLKSNTKKMVAIPPRKKVVKNDDGDKIGEEKTDLKATLSEEDFQIYQSTSPGHFYIHDIFELDSFNASKMALYYDYEEILQCKDHDLINELLLGSKVPDKVDKSKVSELNMYCEKENYFVVNIDSSQHVAINEAKNRKAIVIQGPPGTGKSQTITNLISQLLSENKKILFVAEKRAALDVVYQRLKSSGLEQQTVIIHNSELNKSEMYKSFLEYINEEHDNLIEQEWEKVSNDVDTFKIKVANYLNELKSVDSKSGLIKADIFTLHSQFSHIEYDYSVSEILLNLRPEELERFLESLNELIQVDKKIPDLPNNFWLNKTSNFLPTEKNKSLVKENVAEVVKIIEVIQDLKDEVQKKFFDIQVFDHVQDYIKVEHKYRKMHFELVSSFIEGNEVGPLVKYVDLLKENYKYKQQFNNQASEALISELYEYYSRKVSFISYATPTYWKNKKILKGVYGGKFKSLDIICSLKGWLDFHNALSGFMEIKNNFPLSSIDTLFFSSDFGVLKQLILNGKKFSDNLSLIFEGNAKKFLLVNSDMAFEDSYIRLFEISKLLKENFLILNDHLKFLHDSIAKPFVMDTVNSGYLESSKQFALKCSADFQHFDLVSIFITKLQLMESDLKLKGLYEVYFKKFRSLANADDFIRAQVYKGWHERVVLEANHLKGFDSDLHTNLVERFKGHVDGHHILAKKAVVNNLAKLKKQTTSIDHNALKMLNKESLKQRRVRSPRELMEDGCLSTMISIKRCWLMSPLSISQVLPNVKELFDVVIFDEASQVKVEDSIPAIYRGKNLIVVGDNKQMPPTNFFSGSSDEELDDDENDLETSESILDQALKAYPDVLLEWHYRSQSEALIAFSNFAFYGGRLIAPPNPHTFVLNKPIEFVKVENGIFNTKNGNVNEAQLIVDEIVSLINQDPSISLGVISMGMSQQKVIEKLLDERREKDLVFSENYEKALNFKVDGAFVGFFNKNLENVQGDERDVIFISVGYAPPKLGEKLRLAFGPLSTKGGGRRLNVAITRAKKKIKVFCSFNPELLETTEEAFASNPDRTFFARYLQYAKHVSDGNASAAQNILDMFPVHGQPTFRKTSRFNLDVKRELEILGYKVSSEVGTCGFYVDLAVEHPIMEKTFILGIECDGAIFHSSDYARDRDRARQKLLEDRGWKIHRIWSQDWSRNRKAELEKIKKILAA